MAAHLTGNIPLLQNAGKNARADFEKFAVVQRFSKGEMLAFEGDNCPNFFMVASGRLRVYKIGENGREITLYHVTPYESCVLTTFCILSHTHLPAYAIADTDMELIIIPAAEFRHWVDKYDVWRDHLFNILSVRLNEILGTIEKITFQRVDVRIAAFLVRATSKNDQDIRITHENLARELGSSRVVISRILEDFQREGLVELARGRITVRNYQDLKKISQNPYAG